MTDREDPMASWADYRRHVLGELERLNGIIERFDSKLDKIVDDNRKDLAQRDTAIWSAITKNQIDIAMLQVKSGMWGAVAGVVVMIPVLILQFMKH